MTDIAISIPQAEIELLEQLYTCRGRTEILQFLDQYPFLVRVLLEAPEKRQYFPASELFLEVEQDPEAIDWIMLVLSILMNLDLNDAVIGLISWTGIGGYITHTRYAVSFLPL